MRGVITITSPNEIMIPTLVTVKSQLTIKALGIEVITILCTFIAYREGLAGLLPACKPQAMSCEEKKELIRAPVRGRKDR